MATVAVTDDSFKADVLESDKAVLVDFWAEWCGPCRVMEPILEELSDDKADTLIVSKLNVDENPETAGTYGVMSIPTMIVFKGGQPVGQIVGALPKDDLIEKLQGVLS